MRRGRPLLLFLLACAAASPAAAQGLPRVALVPAPGVPPETVRALVAALSEHAEVLPAEEVGARAEEAGLSLDAPETTLELIRTLEIVLLVRARVGARRRLQVTFHEPAAGQEFLDHHVSLARGGHLPEDALLELSRVMGDAVAAGVAVAEPGATAGEDDGGEVSPPAPHAEPDEAGGGEDGGLSALAEVALGGGLRDLELTRPGAGTLTMTTSPFPTAAVIVGARHDGLAGGRLALRLDARYRTSFGLVTREARQDGSTREVGSRAQDVLLTVGVRYRLAPGARATSLGADVGLRWSAFSLLDPVSVPSSSYLGPVALAALDVPLGGPRVVASAALGAQLALGLGELGALVATTSAAALVARGGLRVGLGASFVAALRYDEVHVLFARGQDVERRLELALGFAP